MDHRMRVTPALILLLLICTDAHTFSPETDGPVVNQEAIEGHNTTLHCDSAVESAADELMLLVWYKNDAPIYSYDARSRSEWSSESFNTTGRLKANISQQPTTLTVSALREDDQELYHCRVDFLLSPTRNIGVNLTIVVLPSPPFFFDEVGNKVEEKIGPYHEGDTLVLSCLVIGGRPPPRISWYSGETLVDASDGASDIPGVKENELYLPLTRDNAAALSCRASNTRLAPPVVASLQIELYLPAYNVSIHWVEGTLGDTLQAGKPALVQCSAHGSYPPADLAWWLDHKHLTQHSNQSFVNATGTAISFLQLTPGVADAGATLACVATNPAMAPSRGSKADIITLNVTYSPIVEVSLLGDESPNEVVELDPLHLKCDVKANPPVDRFKWYFNDNEIHAGDIWGFNTTSGELVVEEATRHHAGRYNCAAGNSVGQTTAEHISVTVFYPPECDNGITLIKETVNCNVRALPTPDTYFWHIQPSGSDMQHLTTGSALLPLSQVTGPLPGTLKVTCDAGNGIASQETPCERILSLEHLRPQQPQQCDLAYEYEEFQMRCIPVENATYYEVSVWRMSTSNTSLILERRASMGFGSGQAMAQGGGAPWLVRGGLGKLKAGDEAGASACNRYGCSRALLLRPTENLLQDSAPPWWEFLLEKDVAISVGAVVLVAAFLISTFLVVRLARRSRAKPSAPVIQVLQLDDIARDYLDTIGEHKVRASCSLRSCSSVYSEGSAESGPAVDRRRKPMWTHQWDAPPPDVTLTLHRESAV
ncbi:B-cell receptor CD22-like [Choristoneura fumiferana]|uniref:B-cell receptor CD22-like n=1 Tax=Choristoneura fumiferana TaxID=7141 RepID=UPI003D1583DE